MLVLPVVSPTWSCPDIVVTEACLISVAPVTTWGNIKVKVSQRQGFPKLLFVMPPCFYIQFILQFKVVSHSNIFNNKIKIIFSVNKLDNDSSLAVNLAAQNDRNNISITTIFVWLYVMQNIFLSMRPHQFGLLLVNTRKWCPLLLQIVRYRRS